MKQVGILVFDEVEVLDFAGPFEVFSITEDSQKQKLFKVHLLGTKDGPISARNGMRVLPDRHWSDAGPLDVLIVPGGYGAEKLEILNKPLLEWLGFAPKIVPIVASVCTGAFLLAEAGVLDGLAATTHWMDLDELEKRWPRISVIRDRRIVDQGKILTCGGISAGIDQALHLVARLEGLETAQRTAKRMEYRWQFD